VKNVATFYYNGNNMGGICSCHVYDGKVIAGKTKAKRTAQGSELKWADI
jgi:hypothetical protein